MMFETNKKVQSFVNLMFEFSMMSTINKPTRVTKDTATTAIDNITNWILNSDFKSAIVRRTCVTTSQLNLLMSLNNTLILRMIWKNVYTKEILMKTHLIVLNSHF